MKTYKYFLAALGAVSILGLCLSGPALTHHKPGHNPPGHGNKKPAHTKEHGVGNGGPPAWAPAWGYRGKRKLKYRHRGEDRYVEADDLVRLPTVGYGNCNREVIGAILGGTVGAATGSRAGKGDGKIFTTIGGAILGTLVGGYIGRQMDQADQNCVGQILERAPTGKTVVWRDPDRNGDYRVTPTRTYKTEKGEFCREYQTKIVIGGRVENANGTACRQADGTWRKVRS